MYALNVSMEADEVSCMYIHIHAIKTKSSGFFPSAFVVMYIWSFLESKEKSRGSFSLAPRMTPR